MTAPFLPRDCARCCGFATVQQDKPPYEMSLQPCDQKDTCLRHQVYLAEQANEITWEPSADRRTVFICPGHKAGEECEMYLAGVG